MSASNSSSVAPARDLPFAYAMMLPLSAVSRRCAALPHQSALGAAHLVAGQELQAFHADLALYQFLHEHMKP